MVAVPFLYTLALARTLARLLTAKALRSKAGEGGLRVGVGGSDVARPGSNVARPGSNGTSGAKGDRTPDLRTASATLSQLSYGPERRSGLAPQAHRANNARFS